MSVKKKYVYSVNPTYPDAIIRKAEFVKESEKSVWYKIEGRRPRVERAAKQSTYRKYFLDFEEARKWVIGRIEDKINFAKRRIQWREKDLSTLKEMKEEDIPETKYM